MVKPGGIEAVLHRPVAAPDVMGAQLMHLADLAGWPTISVQVVPGNAAHSACTRGRSCRSG